MKSWRDCNAQEQEEAALDTSYIPTIMHESAGASHLDETDQPSGTRFLEIKRIVGKIACLEECRIKITHIIMTVGVHLSCTDIVFSSTERYTCIFGTENRKAEEMDKMLELKESCPSFHNQNYIETIKEFQSYVDMVKRLTRPGCSVETLDVALSSVSSLMNTLSAIFPKEQIIHSSL